VASKKSSNPYPSELPEPTGGERSRKLPVQPIAPGLYVVATPIGNMGDLSPRALTVLAGVETIACEDTRVTGRLLFRHGLETRRLAYHEHNAARVRPLLMKRLEDDESVALVSDAGTPLISDPGYRLVAACADAGISVFAVPGPSAVLAALMVAGLPTDRFLYAGFLPPREVARRRTIVELSSVPATLVILESPRRLASLLADLADGLGDRRAAVGRELTKRFEEVRRGRLSELAAQYEAAANSPKGEITVVVGPPEGRVEQTQDDLDERLRAALEEHSASEAARRVAAETGRKRREVYARALALSGADGGRR
jgi:16S rRNA (cytidine1402-2'-O)-methyltransferase